jgi:hypothetical protein
MKTIDTMNAPRPMNDTRIPAIKRKLGNKTYEVYVHFSQTSNETMTDIVRRVLEREVDCNAA